MLFGFAILRTPYGERSPGCHHDPPCCFFFFFFGKAFSLLSFLAPIPIRTRLQISGKLKKVVRSTYAGPGTPYGRLTDSRLRYREGRDAWPKGKQMVKRRTSCCCWSGLDRSRCRSKMPRYCTTQMVNCTWGACADVCVTHPTPPPTPPLQVCCVKEQRLRGCI